MKAAIVKEAGGPENLTYGDIEKPGVRAGEILIRVHAAGVNGADLLQRAGSYAPPEGTKRLLLSAFGSFRSQTFFISACRPKLCNNCTQMTHSCSLCMSSWLAGTN